MKLLDKLDQKNIILPLKAQTQSDAIKEILYHLQKINVLKKAIKSKIDPALIIPFLKKE